MAARLEQLAEYYRSKGYEQIAQKAERLAQEARMGGMPDHFRSASPPKGPLTTELAEELNVAFGSNAADDIHFKELDDTQLKWREALANFNRTQRASIRNTLNFLQFKEDYNTVGLIRGKTIEELAQVRRFTTKGSRLGANRAEFLKNVFRRLPE